jgi:DNA-binding transcriptional LysR family regulator
MHIETLKTFCDLVDTGSFSKAAQLNYVSQSAVSQQLKMLEARYDCVLVERGAHRRIALTEAGRLFHAECRELLERFQRLEGRLRERSTAIAGTLRVATVYSVGLHALPPYVTQFMKSCPQVTVHIEYSRTNRICDAVGQDTLDLGIVALPLPRANLSVVPWRAETLVLVCAPGHRLARRRSVSLEHLRDEPFVAFERGIHCQYHLIDPPGRDAVDQLVDAEVLRPHALKCR